MEQSIIKALKSSCGNKNIKFQVIIQDNQLHVYANHRKEYQPNYSVLKENVSTAIAFLHLDAIDDVWLYGRPLGQIEANWQSYIERSILSDDENKDTAGSRDNLDSTVDFDSKAEFNFSTNDAVESREVTQDSIAQPEIDVLTPSLIEELNLTSFVEFEADDSTGDTGLLRDTGLIHEHPLKEVEIDTSYSYSYSEYSEKPQPGSGAENDDLKLERYCFIVNKKLLQGETAAPSKDMMRMIKFLHHLSPKDRQQLLPILDSYFRSGTTPGLNSTLPAVQSWFAKIKALTEEERHVFAVWLSRYCANPTETLAEFRAIVAKNEAETNNKQSNSSTEYNFVTVKQDYPSQPKADKELLAEPKFQLPPRIKKLLLPLVWIVGTIIFTILGIINHNSSSIVTSAKIPQLCQNTIGSPEYCRLGINLAGEKAIAQAPESLFPLGEVTETVADYGCARYANLKAGVDIAKIAPEASPVIATQGEKIFPHIYTTVVEQKNAKNTGSIKVGCVYTTGKGQRSPTKLAAEVIPLNWPTKHYQQQQDNISFGIYNSPIALGLYTIFAALGIVTARWLNLGLQVNRNYTIYLVALLLGLVQVTIVLLPAFGLPGAIFMPILTIITASFLFKDFELNWKRGYSSVAISILVIVAIQLLFYGFSRELITHLI